MHLFHLPYKPRTKDSFLHSSIIIIKQDLVTVSRLGVKVTITRGTGVGGQVLAGCSTTKVGGLSTESRGSGRSTILIGRSGGGVTTRVTSIATRVSTCVARVAAGTSAFAAVCSWKNNLMLF